MELGLSCTYPSISLQWRPMTVLASQNTTNYFSTACSLQANNKLGIISLLSPQVTCRSLSQRVSNQGSHKNLRKRFRDFSMTSPGQNPNFQTKKYQYLLLRPMYQFVESITDRHTQTHAWFDQGQPTIQLILLVIELGAHHWSPISLVPHLIGSPSHWSPISLVPHLIDPPISTHAPLISLVPHLIGPPDSLVPHLIGPPSHWSPSHWCPNS